MGHIKRKDLENAIVLVPTSSELKTMTEQIKYLLQKIENNNKQIQTLIQQRDALLPTLMSGEVKI
jgi:type I restriction enzyme S subunit